MQLKPYLAIEDIPTGNPYKGEVILSNESTFKDVTNSFPGHTVFLKSGMTASFPTSEILNQQIHVFYDANGRCKEPKFFGRRTQVNAHFSGQESTC
ncbi:hypothetical protein PsAD37_03433 [Pseudovibrio sp. Ad37]|nr:hypothetical protein PsAD37_03433 [Pseudovibrio sp. Ad37]